MKKLAAGFAALLACASTAHAAAIISFEASGANVTATLSGSLNIAGLTPTGLFGAGVSLLPNQGRVGVGTVGARQNLFDDVLTGPTAFGAGSVSSLPTSSTGDALFLLGSVRDLFLPEGYSGGPLSATTVFAGSFSSLGLTPGDYVYTLRTQDTLTVRVARASVPEPGTLALLGLGLAGLAAVRRRRQ